MIIQAYTNFIMDRLGKDGANYTNLKKAMKRRMKELKEIRPMTPDVKEEMANLTRDMLENRNEPYTNYMAVKVKGSNETEERKIKAVPKQE